MGCINPEVLFDRMLFVPLLQFFWVWTKLIFHSSFMQGKWLLSEWRSWCCWMLRRWAHSKRELISRKTQMTVNVTSYTRARTPSELARTSANTKEGCSSKISRTWTAGKHWCEKTKMTEVTCFSKILQMTVNDCDCLLCSYRTVKCTKHNWKLNVSTMEYVNPPDSFMQDDLGKCAALCGKLS